MNLQETMSEMAGRSLTLEEAKDFCNDQFGRVAAYLQEEYEKDKAVIVWSIEDVQGINENLSDQAALTVLKNFERHHEGSMDSMWQDLKFHIDELNREMST